MKTVTWLLLIVLFTYTPIITATLFQDGDIWKEYFTSQHYPISLFVNFGILGMVLIDYFASLPTINGRMTILLFIGFLSVFIVYIHSGIVFDNKGDLFKGIINNKWLSCIAHIVFLGIVGYFKYLSLNKNDEEVVASPVL